MTGVSSLANHYDDLEIGIVLHDPESADIIYVNEFATQIYGYSEEELLSMKVSEFSSESFSQKEAVQRVQTAAAGTPQRFEWQNKKPTGELYWVEVKLSAISIADTEYVVALVSDITDYKLDLYHLRVLTRITRHNLRNNLTVIDGLFEQMGTTEQAQTDESEQLIRRSIDDLLGLTEWISDLNTIAASEGETRSVNLGAMVTEIAERYQEQYPDIAWKIACEDIWAAAGTPLRTAVKELLENAVTHNPHHELDITVSVTQHSETGQACIQITDTGLPIPEVEIEPIVGGYDPDPLSHGNGIGLWEVQTVVSAYGGRVSITENTSERKIIEILLPRSAKSESDSGS